MNFVNHKINTNKLQEFSWNWLLEIMEERSFEFDIVKGFNCRCKNNKKTGAHLPV